MISLTAPNIDMNGCVVSPKGTARSNIARRAKRVPTLDGGAVLVDQGWCEPDRAIALKLRDTTAAQKTVLDGLLQNYATVILSCDDGCYEVVLSGLSIDGLTIILTANVYQRLD